MIKQQLLTYVNTYEMNGVIELPSPVLTSTKQDEEFNLAYAPNFILKVEDTYGYINSTGNVDVIFSYGGNDYTAYAKPININQNGIVTLQYTGGLTIEENNDSGSDDGSSDGGSSDGGNDSPTIGDLSFTIDSANYDVGASSFTDNGDDTWTANLMYTSPHGSNGLPFYDADGNVIFDALAMFNNNQGDPVFDIVIDEPDATDYSIHVKYSGAQTPDLNDDVAMADITAPIGTYNLTGKIRLNVANATVYLTDDEYNGITNANNYYTYDGNQYDSENNGMVYKRYTIDLTDWQNVESNANVTLEVFNPNSGAMPSATMKWYETGMAASNITDYGQTDPYNAGMGLSLIFLDKNDNNITQNLAAYVTVTGDCAARDESGVAFNCELFDLGNSISDYNGYCMNISFVTNPYEGESETKDDWTINVTVDTTSGYELQAPTSFVLASGSMM